jgi:hypothetical protein
MLQMPTPWAIFQPAAVVFDSMGQNLMLNCMVISNIYVSLTYCNVGKRSLELMHICFTCCNQLLPIIASETRQHKQFNEYCRYRISLFP